MKTLTQLHEQYHRGEGTREEMLEKFTRDDVGEAHECSFCGPRVGGSARLEQVETTNGMRYQWVRIDTGLVGDLFTDWHEIPLQKNKLFS